MMTCHVVPVHSIIVELIKDSQAILGSAALNGLAIVRLRLADTKRKKNIQYKTNILDEESRYIIALSRVISYIRLETLTVRHIIIDYRAKNKREL